MTAQDGLGSLELIAAVVDPGSWRGWDEPVSSVPADPGYRADLARARERTGLDEAVVTGEGRIRGRRVAVIACEFAFLAGSIGVDGGERLMRAVERATRERLPLLASPASGGTRMQEGTIAFLQMVKVAAAIADHKQAGLPYLVYLRHPTTGGVLASWGSLGHVSAAEPGALIGFLGPRVHEALYGEPFPQGVQLAENLRARGLVDGVIPPAEVAAAAARVLDVLCAPREIAEIPDAQVSDPPSDVPVAESIRRSRRADRPGARTLLDQVARDVTLLSGTAAGECDPGLLLALARFGAAPCVVLGQDGQAQRSHHPLGPAGLREARRGMRLAAELGLPLVSVIDTGGAALSREAEEGGLAGEIARCLAELVTLPAPTVCLLMGEGAGGGALALLPADRVIAAEHAWLSPLPPEGASVILYRTTERAAEIAQSQRVRSGDLLADSIVDRIVAERPDAADEPEAFLARVGAVLEAELAGLLRRDPAERMAARRQRYRRLGSG
ncbi:carboxyl transferase domain-containing protein [Actinomadura sp. HBU206391]|uniref:carboxyl transferase domain-containing protein n=1 Tax=Actinomadura sp. HBU206391 TaxID=2731692 RepID=UPI0016507776|nr:carboxyl transferase domain-containing protein [Actinomadura sp. HBU206391]MBC6463100.1 acetyl-CoA carboxyl transferase [Actinomadura sp. HBU206391]